jgi:predicted MFS family arabinose efflux permease
MTSIVGKIWFFTYNPYFNLVGLNYANYGQIFCLLNVVAGVCSLSSKWLQKPLGVMGSLILAVVCLALPLMIMGAVVLPACACLVVFQNVVRGYFDPFIKDFYQKHLRSETRSTVSSVQSACTSLGQCIAMLIFSWMLKGWSLPTCLLALAMFTLVAGMMLILAYRRIFASN